MRYSLLVSILLLSLNSFSQVVSSGGGTGDWNDAASWSPAGVPTTASGTITILNGHTITVTDTRSADELTVAAGGTLIIGSGATFTIADGAGDDLTVSGAIQINIGAPFPPPPSLDGTLLINGQFVYNGTSFTGDSNTRLQFLANSSYDHQVNPNNDLPVAAWDATSTCQISGTASGLITPGNLNQSFGNFIVNSSLTGADFIDLGGNLQTVAGDFDIQNLGSGFLYLTLGPSYNLAIGGDLTLGASTGVVFNFDNNSSITVGGDYSSASGFAIFTNAGTLDLDVAGSYTDSGTSDLTFSTGSSNIEVGGDFDVSGTISRSNTTGSATVTFDGGGVVVQNLVSTLNQASVDLSFNFGSGLTPSSFNLNGNFITVSGNYTVVNGSTLDLSTGYLGGTGDFTLDGTSELQLGSTDASGAIQNNTTAGNLRTSGMRTFSSGAQVTFNGAGAQVISNAYPTDSGLDLEINNTNGVNLLGDVTVGGDLTLLDGDLNVGSNQLTLQGTISPNSNFIDVTSDSDIIINGSGAFGVFPFAGTATLNNFSFGRVGQTVDFNQDVTINGLLTLSNGDLDFSNQTLVLNNGSTSFSGTGSLLSNSTSVLNITGSGPFGNIQFNGSPPLGSMIINRDGGTVSLIGPVNIVSALDLDNGSFDNSLGTVLMSNNSTLTKNTAVTFTGNPPETSNPDTYNLIYEGASQTTGSEIPTAANPDVLGNLTISTSGAITLDQALQVNGAVTLNSGFLSGASDLTVLGNWVRNVGALSSFTGTIIFDGNTTISGAGTPTFSNIQVTSTASMTFPSGIINFTGDLQVDAGATFSANGGTVVLNGSGLQQLGTGSNTFNNITVNKTGGDVTLTSGLLLGGVLNVQSVSAVNSNGNLVVVSTSDGTTGNGSIASLAAGGTINGDVTVQRFVSGEGRIWRYLSSPVTNATVADWQDDFPITGNFTGRSTTAEWPEFPDLLETSPSLYYFDESLGGVFGDRFVAHPTTDNTEPLVVGRGYSAFMREAASAVTIDLTGPINQGDTDLNVTFASSADTTDGWNLVGNPYPSSIDWDATGGVWTKTNVNGSIAVRDNGGSGTFRYWNGSAGSFNDGVIAAGQAFWVKTSGAGASLIVREGAKVSTTGEFYSFPAPITDQLEIVLSDGIQSDRTFLAVFPGSVDGFDDEYDAPKLNNDIFDLSTYDSEGTRLAINFFPSFNCEKIVGLNIQDTDPGSYSLSFDKLNSFDPSYSFLLVDNFTSSTTAVNIGTVYNFDISSDEGSFNDRFELVIARDALDNELVVEGEKLVCEDNITLVSLPSPQAGVSYQAVINGTTFEGLVVSDGMRLDFEIPGSALSEGLNTVGIEASLEGCSSELLLESVEISRVVIAQDLSIESSGDVCEDDVSIVLPISEEGIGYQVILNSSPFGPVVLGEGGSLTFTVPNESLVTGLNDISIEGSFDGCIGQLLDQTLSVNKTVIGTDLTIESGGDVCLLDAEIIIAASQESIGYQLLLNSVAQGGIVTGTGSDINFIIPNGDLIEDENLIEIQASFDGCSSRLLEEFIMINKTVISTDIVL
ncbi:MAG: beta strand repeat-containing protein [Fulvivirga sp.]